MSNYVYCVAGRDFRDQISAHFSEYGQEYTNSTDLAGHKHSHIQPIIWLATRGSSVCMDSAGAVFKGYAVCHARREIIFQPRINQLTDGYFEGCFFHADVVGRESSKKIIIRNDVFGLLPIFYFSILGLFACSDSLLALTNLRKSVGIGNHIDEQQFIARLGLNGFCDQLISVNTAIQGIHYALPGTVIHLDTSDPALRIRVEHAGADRIFGASRLSYQEDIQVAALAMSGFLAGLASLPGSFLRQDISGGQDSRLALAATLAGGIDTAKLELQSVARLSNDMEVATRVADHLGLTLNGPANHKPVSTSYPPFAVWFAASAGVYDPLYALNTRLGQNALFMVGGHGAEVYKGNYGWHPVRRIAGWVGPDIADAVSHAARSGLESFGIDPASQTASEWHYLAFRNPLHGGRFINSTLYGVRPILNRRLVSVAHKTMRKRWWRARRPSTVISDLLIHINPDLAALPFDTAAKTLSPGYIAKRGKLLGKMPPTQPYAIQGRPEHTLSGPLPGLINTAIRAGFDGPFKTQVILDMLEKAHDLAPDALKSQVQAMVAMVTSGLTDPVTPDSRPSRMAGKMLTLFLTG